MSLPSNQHGPSAASAALPPAMAEVQSKSVDELLKEMNRMPLFMTSLDDSDGEGGENPGLEAMKALAYEGSRVEVAENFRQNGNECARAKQWQDAKEFYDKAIESLKMPHKMNEDGSGIEVQVDEETDAKKEKEIEEACYVNRALCHLEKKNYRSVNQDCASTLRLNPSNVKAFYRSATACLALDKLPEAVDACTRGLSIDSSNAPLKALQTKISARQTYIDSVVKARREREEKIRSEKATLALALKSRGIRTKNTDKAPDLEDATIKLESALDPSSTLSFPAILLYPLHSQSDFIKAFSEKEKLNQHLDYIFPLPWDEAKQYTMDGVEAYMETAVGGLIKAGKKMTLGKILGSGKVEVTDGLVRFHVVPKARAEEWIEDFKKRNIK
ncbi:tetratricopeptide repeat protein 4 [Pleomassaria siparia CBS 279.74]|uniref:Tetratricopeptide repeat protein 4 n=1 Tax=Pleomassaria siparia CBS 279.74 TaxID=1314801 RepID=A0A6G1KG48_9PLEO|nr:tetratricopeptide repeat protein 4 [Pleomassaria siparia CBS 279.74]